MAIGNIQVIQIGLPNESTGSDSLYSAFTKTQTNFTTLFGCSSPYNTFVGNTGIGTSANANTGTVTITNTGVTNIIAGTNITIDQSNGNVTISSNGGGNGGSGGGTVTSVGVVPISTDRLTVTNSPIISSGNISIDLSNSGVTAGNYSYPSLTVDQYGRITNIANANSLGTVTSVGVVTSGTGIQISGGPITTAGNITIINTGVTRLTAGTGIGLSGSNGNITVSATQIGGTVTSVGLSSSSLTVSAGAITTAGTLTVDLSPNIQVSGSLTLSSSENLLNGAAASLLVTASYITVTGASTSTLAAGTNGLIKTFMMYALSNGGDMVITVTNAGWQSSGTGTITIGTLGAGCTLQYINNKWFCVGQNGVTFG